MSIEKTASLIGVGIVMILLGIAIFTREDRARPDMEGAGAVRDLADGAPGRSLIEDGRGRPREWRIADGNIVATDPQSDADGGRRTDADRDSVSDGPRQVKVRPYDSFWKIAERELRGNPKTNVDRIVALNPKLGKVLHGGDKIVLPAAGAPVASRTQAPPKETVKPTNATASATDHLVKKGESLWTISQRYFGSSSNENIDRLRRANPSIKGDRVVAGRTLRIPAIAAR